jgi:Flp pilus assembly protein CpaB
MRRGRIFIYIALIIVVVLVGVGIWWWKSRSASTGPSTTEPQVTPMTLYVEIITAGQNIYPGTSITEDMLNTIQIPQDQLVAGEYTNVADVVGMYAKLAITQGVPIVSSMISVTPGNVSLPGSTWAPFIPQGLTAVAVPITRLTSVAYGIRDGDYVNIIATFMVVDVDPAYQTILPNRSAGVTASNGSAILLGAGVGADATTALSQGEILNLVAQVGSSGGDLGRVEYSEELEQPFYVVPSEEQRARMVSQMIMQNVQVLHVGTFPLPGEVVSDLLIAPTPGPGATATPVPAATEGQVSTIVRPDIITLMVPNQDAVTLTYLVYSGAQITLTLRNPNDQVLGEQPDAATLEYLLTQYDIPVPAKLPYALQPRTDYLFEPLTSKDYRLPLYFHFYTELFESTPK